MSADRSTREGSYRFDTPERVEVAYDLAGLGSRFVAALVDGLLMGLLLVLFFVAGALGLAFVGATLADLAGESLDSPTMLALIAVAAVIATFVVLWGYHVFFEMVWHGQTPGKRAMGLRVIKEGGYPVDLAASAIRNLVRVVDYLPWSYVLGAIVMFLDGRSRRLGDIAAGTLVVKERRTLAIGALSLDPALLSAATADDGQPLPDPRRLTSDDQTLLRDYFQRRQMLAPPAAEALAGQLARALAARLGHDLGDEPPERFLNRLGAALAERGETS
jgi:uncharacterized RDD family membrane protein YckC